MTVGRSPSGKRSTNFLPSSTQSQGAKSLERKNAGILGRVFHRLFGKLGGSRPSSFVHCCSRIAREGSPTIVCCKKSVTAERQASLHARRPDKRVSRSLRATPRIRSRMSTPKPAGGK